MKPKILVLLAGIVIFLLTIVIADMIASRSTSDSYLPALAYLIPTGAFIGLVYWYRQSR